MRVRGEWLRSKGKVSEARVATVTSEVAHPGGEKAAGAWHGRGDAAKAGRRPLHDELGGHWQQIPGQTDKSEGWRIRGKDEHNERIRYAKVRI